MSIGCETIASGGVVPVRVLACVMCRWKVRQFSNLKRKE